MVKTHGKFTFEDFTLEQVWEYDKWYNQGEGHEIGNAQRDCLRRLLGDGNGRRLLDIGSGTGYFSRWFKSLGFDVTGIDSAPKMVAYAYRDSGPGINYQLADASKLPFQNDSFDLVVFTTSFEFIDRPEQALEEAFRVASEEILMLLLNPDHEMNRKRIEKSHSRPSPFSVAKLRSRNEVVELMKKAAPEKASVVPAGCALDIPYYFVQSFLSGGGQPCDNPECK